MAVLTLDLQVSLSWGSIAKSFHSLHSLSVSCLQVILGLPGPCFQSVCQRLFWLHYKSVHMSIRACTSLKVIQFFFWLAVFHSNNLLDMSHWNYLFSWEEYSWWILHFKHKTTNWNRKIWLNHRLMMTPLRFIKALIQNVQFDWDYK